MMAEDSTAKKKKKSDAATIVDISGEQQQSEAGGKNAPKKKRKRKKGKLILVCAIILLLTLAAGFVFVVLQFNPFEMRTAVFGFIHNLDPDYKAVYLLEASVTERETALNTREATLDSLQETLSKREADIVAAESSTTPVYRPPVNEDDVIYMQNIGKIYAAMEPGNAANIMVKLYSVEDMAAIIYYMKQSSAAAILELMEPSVAAQITDKLLHE